MSQKKKFKYDVFVSYAQVNNKPLIPGDNSTRWITNFADGLRRELDEELGRTGAARLFIDFEELAGNQSVPSRIQEAVTDSATVVVLFSKGY